MPPTINQIKRIAIIIGTIFFGVLVYSLSIIISRHGKIETYVSFAPSTSVVTVDGKTIKNNGKNYFSEGAHSLTAHADNFETYEIEVTITEESQVIIGTLTPSNDDGEEYLRTHPSEFETVKNLADSANAISTQSRLEKTFAEAPITEYLPLYNSLFKIDYHYRDDNIVFYLDTSETYVDVAVQKLKSLLREGERLESYDIEFKTFQNPLQNIFVENAETQPMVYIKKGFESCSSFNIVAGTETDQYFYATVSTGSEADYSLVTYRLILAKKEAGWKMVAGPSPILTIYNSPNVPEEIIRRANM